MDIEVTNYNEAVAQSELAMTTDYFAGHPPFRGAPGYIPQVPLDERSAPRVSAEECEFKYAEITLPDGDTVLAIITPWSASGGPGLRYRVTIER